MRQLMSRLRQLWEYLRSSLWFLPTLLVGVGVALAVALIESESFVEREQLTTRWPRLFGAGAEGSRGMLAAIASSMITVAGVAFSITVVAFTLASSQYTSRILRNFMRDRSNQAVLGVFLGVFAYCLVVLRTIRGGDEEVFVPSVAVLVAVLLAFVAIGFLVFFIHHIASSIQASYIIEGASEETIGAIERLFPEENRADVETPLSAPIPTQANWRMIPARTTGYIQGIDEDSFNRVATESQTMIRMERTIGDFVIEATPLAFIAGGKETTTELAGTINAACTIGRYRTVYQDVAFGIRQIVDIALKALSPGINDTTTAVICIDFLGAILVRLAPRSLETARSRHQRVILPRQTFAGFLGDAFAQIRQNADGNVAVLKRLLEILEIISGQTTDPSRRQELTEHAALVMEMVERSVPSAADRQTIKAAMERFLETSSSMQPALRSTRSRHPHPG
jgi:uncharacterized membrane protein